MSFSPRPCTHCGGLSFHVLPGVHVELGTPVTMLGLQGTRRLPTRWLLTIVACTHCGRTETFTGNAAQLANEVPGAHVAQAVTR